MATVSKRLFGPAQLTTSAATKYTCPASTVAVIRRMRVSNPSGNGAQTFSLSIGANAAGTRIYDAVALADGGSLDVWGPFSLAAGEIIQAFASDADVVLEVDGTETS